MASLDTSAPNVGTRFRRAMCAGSTRLLIECPKCDQHRLRQEHKAGEKMFVDWKGATIPVHDATTGQGWPASLFVSLLQASSYAYAEATRAQQMQNWIQAHIHALEFYGGAPTLTVPDNTKTAVPRACRYDPDLNPTYQEFAVSLRDRSGAGASLSATGQSQSRERSASMRTRDQKSPQAGLISDQGVTVKMALLVALPPGVVRTTFPVLAPVGTMKVTCLSEDTVKAPTFMPSTVIVSA